MGWPPEASAGSFGVVAGEFPSRPENCGVAPAAESPPRFEGVADGDPTRAGGSVRSADGLGGNDGPAEPPAPFEASDDVAGPGADAADIAGLSEVVWGAGEVVSGDDAEGAGELVGASLEISAGEIAEFAETSETAEAWESAEPAGPFWLAPAARSE
jgi:hypothetical protein